MSPLEDLRQPITVCARVNEPASYLPEPHEPGVCAVCHAEIWVKPYLQPVTVICLYCYLVHADAGIAFAS